MLKLEQKRISVLFWFYLYSGPDPAASTKETIAQITVCNNHQPTPPSSSTFCPAATTRDPKAKVRNIKAGKQQTSCALYLAAIYDQFDLVHRLRASLRFSNIIHQTELESTHTQHLHGSIKHLYIHSGTSAGLSDLFESVFLGSQPPATHHLLNPPLDHRHVGGTMSGVYTSAVQKLRTRQQHL